MRRFRPLFLILVLGLAAGGLAATSASAGGPDRLEASQRNLIRAATKQYRDVDAAVAAGYVPTEECAAVPGVGGMGYHYVNFDLLVDGEIDPTKPEILVYHDAPNGQLRLGAVEYFQADEDQDLGTSDDRPFLFGQHGFDGPMPGHDPQMPVHYDLHVWLYEHNPSGELATWNPRVTCPES